ncbi:MAG: DUF3047 domain-containing protein [Rhodobacteraceae bacterium]|nr:DUF3047 domain-containing protein [Paracoccaceae bacterium]
MPRFRLALSLSLALIPAAVPGVAVAQQVHFGDGWTEQRFSLFSGNEFSLNGDTLSVRSDDTVSLLWTRLPESMWAKRAATWDWAVDRSVPATDLTRKGGDDRNLSIYFLFLPEAAARDGRNRGVRALLDNPDVRVLMYVWGGAHSRGEILPTPYLGARGRTVVQRGAGTGSVAERVDLARDFERAFGGRPENLVGIAVSSDSDDTGTEVVARISRLRID